MAGRNYSLSVPAPASSEGDFEQTDSVSDFDFDSDAIQTEEILYKKIYSWVLIILGAVIVTAGIVYMTAVWVYDIGRGASSSGDLTTAIAESLDDFDYDTISKYVPASIRKNGFISDSDVFADFRAQDTECGYVFDRVIIDEADPFDDIESLQNGLMSVYGKKIKISSAQLVKLRVLFTDSESRTVTANCNIIPIKVKAKWYFYTGAPVGSGDDVIDFMSAFETQEKQAESHEMMEYDISYVEPVVQPDDEASEIELDFYKDALKDLQSGKCTIRGIEYTMPESVDRFKDIFGLDEAKLAESQAEILKPDETISGLPITFVDETVPATSVYVVVGNITKDDIPYQNGSVTTLYINSNSRFDVTLPGGVTFGTSYDDFVKMYGDVESSEDDAYHGTLADSVYEVTLHNKHNKIYFGFKDNKLVEIQWYYIDMTDYREI